MAESCSTRMKTRNKTIILGLVLIVVVIVLLSIRGVSGSAPLRPATWEFIHAGEIRDELLSYSKEHQGKFPNALSELPLDNMPPEARQFHDPETKQVLDWIYYPGYSRADSPNTIILAAPRLFQKNERITILSDCSVEMLEENEFVKRISEQLNRK